MIAPNKGVLLIAEPFLQDPNFMRSVVCLCEHNEEGSVGFVLNSKYDYYLDEIMPDFEGFNIPVFEGGPVALNTLHFIHQYPNLIDGSLQICHNVFWGGNFETITTLIKNNDIALSGIKFFQGYSGWSAGQLDNEMKQNSWLTVNATSKIIFESNDADTWKQSLTELGGKYKQLIHYPTNPQLN